MQECEQACLALGMNLDLTALDGNTGRAGFDLDREDGPGNHHINPCRRHLEAPDWVMANLEARATTYHPQGDPVLAMAKQVDI
jgi:hypothetical protein